MFNGFSYWALTAILWTKKVIKVIEEVQYMLFYYVCVCACALNTQSAGARICF